MHRDQGAEGRLAALDLLAGKRLGDEIETGAAVRLGNDDAQDPELGHALDQLEIELVVDVVLDRDRQDALVHERANGVLDQPLLVGQLEVHARRLPSPRGPPASVQSLTDQSINRPSRAKEREHGRDRGGRHGRGLVRPHRRAEGAPRTRTRVRGEGDPAGCRRARRRHAAPGGGDREGARARPDEPARPGRARRSRAQRVRRHARRRGAELGLLRDRHLDLRATGSAPGR